jgi:hypothetical protein
MKTQLLTAAVLAVLVVGLGWASASAADGLGGGGPNYVWAGGYWPHHNTLYSRENVPYFAHNPPVYYSYPVPRPYGYSPFPYPPWILTPEVLPPQPVIIRNPYVPQEGSPTPAAPRQAQAPLRIINPYVEQRGVDQPGLPASPAAGHGAVEPSRPQVVYPASLE